MKEEKLYLFKEKHDPKVERQESERMEKVVGVNNQDNQESEMITPMTEIAHIDILPQDMSKIKNSGPINQ